MGNKELYKTPNKFAPKASLSLGTTSSVTGYQTFQFSEKHIEISKTDTSLLAKKAIIGSIIESEWMIGKTVADLGANSGYFALASLLKGASQASAIDLDPEYVAIMDSIRKHYSLEEIFSVQEAQISNYNEAADIIYAFALIHWIYSCTEEYGALTDAIAKLASLTDQVLIIEWVAPNDKAIQEFGHLNFGKDENKEEYNQANFEQGLTENFDYWEILGEVKETRIIYAAYKQKAVYEEIRNSPANISFLDLFVAMNESGLDYRVLRNHRIITEQIDDFADRQIDICVYEEHFKIFSDYLTGITQKISEDKWGELHRIGTGHSEYVNLRLLNSGSGYIMDTFADQIWSESESEFGVRILMRDSMIKHLIYNIVYVIGGSENAYEIYLDKIFKDSYAEISNLSVKNFAFLTEFLEKTGLKRDNPNELLATYSMPYLDYGPENCIYSRVLDFSSARPYISRIYRIDDIVIKQANRELITSEYNNLSKLAELQDDSSVHFLVPSDFREEVSYSSFSMPYLAGPLLSELISGGISSELASSFVKQMDKILEALKKAGVEHRDINPDNIICNDGVLVLIDFGWSVSGEPASFTPIGLNPGYSPGDNNHSDQYSVEKVKKSILESVNEDHTGSTSLDSQVAVEDMSSEAENSNENNLNNLLEELAHYKDGESISASGILFRLALECVHAGRVKEALSYLEEELIINPSNTDALDLIRKIDNDKVKSEGLTAEDLDTFNMIKAEYGDSSVIDDEEGPEEFISVDNKGYKYDVSVIIAVYNNPSLTKQTLDSIFKNSAGECTFEVICIDNGSDEETRDVLNEFLDTDNFRVIREDQNLGYARANNLGIKNRKGRDIVLLNNDIIATDGWLDGLVQCKTTGVGIIGGLLLYPNSRVVQHCWVNIGTEDGRSIAPYHAFQYSDLKDDGIIDAINQSHEVDAVTGACMYITSDCLDSIGSLDEGYENGLEDIDYCIRARLKGMKIVYSPNSIMYHYESMTEGRHEKDIANWQRLNRKWHGTIEIGEEKAVTNANVFEINTRRSRFSKATTLVDRVTEENPTLINRPQFSIIILTHDNIDYTITCLESLFRTLTVEAEVIVVDNASTDDTLIYLENLGNKIRIIRNKTNLSFSKANNQAAATAKGQYLLFLNNDIELLTGWCDFLVSHFENNLETGIQGAKLLYPDGSIQHAGIVYGKVADDIDMHYHIYLTHQRYAPEVNKTRAYQMVTGAMLAIRKKVFDEVNGFDENFIFGYEDLDLCLKAAQQGYKTVYNHEVEAYHHESITKKSEGLFKFESFIRNPDGLDAKNNKYFLKKWSTILRSDADSYYTEDGFYALASDSNRAESFVKRLEDFHREAAKSIVQRGEALKRKLSQMLFSRDGVDFIEQPHTLVRTSAFALANAEAEVGLTVTDNDADWNRSSDSLPKILYTMYGWSDGGGGTILPKTIAKKLASDGFEVRVFYADSDNTADPSGKTVVTKSNDDGVVLYSVKNRLIGFTATDQPLDEINDAGVVSAFNEILEEYEPDIVHFHNFVGLSFELANVAAQTNAMIFYTPHNYHLMDPNLYMINKELKRWDGTDIFKNTNIPEGDLTELFRERRQVAKKLLRESVDFTLAVSNRQKDLLEDFVGYGAKISVVNQVSENVSREVPRRKSKRSPEPLRIGYVGSVMPHKGVHLLPVAAEIFDSGQLEIHIFGESSGQYRTFVNQLSNKSKVIFHGKYDILPDIENYVDIVALPSLWEDCAPLVVAEIISRGVPCLVPDIGGFTDFIIDGYNGLVFGAGSAHSLALQIDKLVTDDSLLSELRANCFLPYDFDYFVGHVATLYQKAFYGISILEEEVKLDFRQKLISHADKSRLVKTSEANSSTENLQKYPKYGFSTKKASGRLPDVLPEIVRLNLGCGLDVRDGFINIDLYSDDPRVVGMDIRNLKLPDNIADQIIASDILEHFPHRETRSILKEWARVLKPGGNIIIRCPNLRLQLQAYMRGDWNADIASYMIFGGQTNPGDYHFVAFDHDTISAHLQATGFEVDSIRDEDFTQSNGYINLNMVVTATKAEGRIKGGFDGFEQRPAVRINTDNSAVREQTGISKGDTLDRNILDDKISNIRQKISELVDVPSPASPELNLVWEGTQMVYHSLALVNREITYELIDNEKIDLSIVPYEMDKIDPLSNRKFAKVFSKDIRIKEEVEASKGKPFLWVRHQWPPKPEPPRGSKWVIMQPWELDVLPEDFITIFNEADEIWTPSNFSRKAFINSGVESDKVQVIPNGVNTDIFTPYGEKFELNTDADLILLFVGGTLIRKGIDILLEAYKKAFDKSDRVCLVIKDMGTETFYKGVNAREYLSDFLENEGAAEIIYLKDEMSEYEMASLYRACDIFVSPYRGEGFSLPTLEAMACGCVPVVTAGGATDDFVGEDMGYRIKSVTEEFTDEVGGMKLPKKANWLVPDKEHLIEILKTLYHRPHLVGVTGMSAAAAAHSKWTWKHSTLRVLKRIDFLYDLELAKPYLQQIISSPKSPFADFDGIIEELSRNNYNSEEIVERLEKIISDIRLDSSHRLNMVNYVASVFAQDKNVQKAKYLLGISKRIGKSVDAEFIEYSLDNKSEDDEKLVKLAAVIDKTSDSAYHPLSLGFGKENLMAMGANLMEAAGDLEGALQMLEIAFVSDTTNSDLYPKIAALYREVGREEDALKMEQLMASKDGVNS